MLSAHDHRGDGRAADILDRSQLYIGVSIPGYASYQKRGYDSAADSDLRNARTCIEAYFADNQQYPDTLAKAQEMEKCGPSSPNVNLVYESKGQGQYRLTITHQKGEREFKCGSDDSEIYWRSKKDPNAQWEKMDQSLSLRSK